MRVLFDYLIFPGFIFSAGIGLLAGWLDRKVSARLQWRLGPPWYQNFADIIKLFGKETIVPQGARMLFFLSPLFGLLSAVLVATVLGKGLIAPLTGFSGDLIVVLYLLTIPAIATILGASSSRNTLASVGASREIKLVLSYELPFILCVIVVIIKNAGAIEIGQILTRQLVSGSNVASLSGAIAFLVTLLCLQAKLGLAPFDIAEAEQEIMAGVLIEYSGWPLAIFRLTRAVLLYSLPLLAIILFLGKDLSPLFIVLKYIGILLFMILVKNTNPRLRIDQAMRFFWKGVTLLASIGVILALFGL